MQASKSSAGKKLSSSSSSTNRTSTVDLMASPTSPKAKSAPATPCNLTPIAFHQHTSHLHSIMNPSPANTLPPDIRKNVISDHYPDELIKQGERSLELKNYDAAIKFFTDCIGHASSDQNFNYLKRNSKVYGHRAEAYLSVGRYEEALEDSKAARELDPKWIRAYYLQGQSQFLLHRHADSLAIFSYGLTREPESTDLFEALVEAAHKSEFGAEFESKYNKLKSLELHSKPFFVVAVLGQELLAKRYARQAIITLESALSLGSDNEKFKGSVFSAISSACCMMADYEKAVKYLEKELVIVSNLKDVVGQCRVHSNLGYTYYKMRLLNESRAAHRDQINLALQEKLCEQASSALNALGHVNAARNDFTSALTSHSRCLEILQQLSNSEYRQFKEYLSIGHLHCMLGDCKAAEERYNEAIQLIESCRGNQIISHEEYLMGRAMVDFNSAYLSLKRRSFHDAKRYFARVLELAEKMNDDSRRTALEMRVYNGLGQAHRLFKIFDKAREYFERQRLLAVKIGDYVAISQALCNLGMTHQHFKEYDSARTLFEENLRLVERDPLLKAYAHSYMASIHFLTNEFEDSRAHYESSMNIFSELDYCESEKQTISLNMAAVYERMGSRPEIGHSNQQTQQKELMTLEQ